MNNPKVSVIIPVYNTEKYLRECLDSVVNQTLKDIEIICVDDGSTDGSCQILRSYAERDSHMRLIEKETNGGTLRARMTGTLAAEGKYIMYIDPDDYLDLSACETAYREITEKKADILQFTCGVEDYCNNDKSKRWLENYLSPKNQMLNTKELQNSLFIKCDVATNMWGKIYDASKCKLACRNTPDIYCYIGEDIFQQFFYSVFAESYVGVSTIPLYWYRHGLGAMNDDWTDLSKYENLCKMALLYEQSVHFAQYVQKDKELLKCAEALGIRMCEDGIRIWNNRVPDDMKDDAFTLFWYYWHGFYGVGEIIRRITGKQLEVFIETNLKIQKYVKLAARYEEDTDWKPLVSVIIPVYNTEKYLRDCINSIVNQKLKDIEIICVNDGSVDGSLRILEEYQEKDPRITVISQANAGLSAARNSGMNRAHGEYIAFVDSDDLLELNALETAYKIAKDNNLDIIQFERKIYYESEQLAQDIPIHIKHITESTEVMSGIQHVMTSKDQGTYCVTVWSALWRRAFLEKHGIVFKEGVIHEDHLFSFQAYMAADRVMRIPDKFYHHRVREDSIMTRPKTAKNVIGYFTSAMGVLEYALNHESDPMEAQEIKREYFQMIGAARNIYRVISNEEKEKIWFASELDNELFKQLIIDRVRLEAANEQQKQRGERLQEALDSKEKESDTLRRNLENQKKESDTLRRDLEKQEKECDTLQRDLEKQKKRADTLQYDLDCVHDSVSFRVGRAITWAPRKMRGGVQCCRDHGAGYTVRRMLYHMGLWKDEEKEQRRMSDCMSQPKVSVIIPVYNAEPYLADTLKSLYAQTYHNIEIFFVDDGSTDRSVEIIRRYTAAHPEAHLLLQEHKFAGVARNYGMQYAQGKYLLFLDADDIFYPDMIEKAVARAEETNADICVFLPERYDQKTGLKKTMTWACDAKLCPKETETFSRLTNSKNIFRFTLAVPWNKLFRRSFVEANKLNFQNTQSSNDVAFVMAALALADRIALCNTILLTYRANNQTSLQGSRDSNPLSFFEARLELRRRLIERNVFDEVELAYVNFALYGCIYYLKTMKTQKSFEQTFNFLKNSGFSELDLLRWPKDSFYQNPQYRIFENREAIMALTAEEYAKRYHLFDYSVPVVSVIIPVCNVESYLRECLDSVVNQTLKDIEIICVDDGSTDSSPEILREYAAKDSRVKVFSQEKSNAGAARNDGLLHACGEYCIFLDADDFFEPNLLEKSYKKALADKADIVAFHFYRYYENGTLEERNGVHREHLTKKGDIFNYQDCPDFIMSIVNPTPWNKLYRTDFIRDHDLKFEEISSSNDITFASVSVAVAERVSILDERLVYYRVGHSGTITSIKSKNLKNALIAVKSGVSQVSKLPYYDKIKNSAMRFAVENIVFAFRHNISDFNDPVAREFYANIKAFFNTQLFNKCTVNALHSKALFDYFRCIRDSEYLELVLMINGNAVSKKFIVDNLIVSLTSYPPRIATVHKTIETLLNQTIRPEKLILWLSDEEFPNREADLPEELLAQTTRGLEIAWCENIRSYKKLIPALRKYPNAIIVTADDDVYYHQQWLERLYLAYIRNPDCIHAHRVTKLYLDDKGDFATVKGGQDCWAQPSYLNKLVGVGGVLYPPHCFPPDVLDESKFMELAPTSDDIWFWLMAAMLGYKVNRVEEPLSKPNYVDGTQDVSLWHINDHGEKLFWVHFNNILQAYPQLERRLRSAWRETAIRNTVPVHSEKEVKVLKNRLSQKEQELKDIRSSISFKTGRTLTFIPRKLRGGVRCYRDHGAGYTLRRTLYHMGMWEDEEAPKGAGNRPKLYKVPDKLRGGVQCYQDHGAGYTFRRTLYHMGLWEDEENPDYKNRPLLTRFADCYSEHSVPYTAWRVLVKLHMAKDGKEPALIQRMETKTPVQKKPGKAAEQVKKDYAYYSTLPPEKYPEELKLWYKRVTKEELDLDNPQTYNEKIQWMKLYDSTPLKTRLADKYLVRAWVKQKIGGEYLIPLLGVWDSFDEIDFDKLPNQFVLKANHGSGWNIIVKDKSTFDKEEARKKFDVWMHTNFAFRAGLELHYMNIPPKIIAEEYMENLGSLYDYKVCCADGKPRFLWIDIDRYTDHRRVVYSLDWERLSFQINEKVLVDSRDYPKPECLEEMIGAAEILCKEFAQVRVDFYVVDGKLYFGEMTFTDASGVSRMVPREMEYEIGSWITLPPKSPIPMRLIYQDKRPED